MDDARPSGTREVSARAHAIAAPTDFERGAPIKAARSQSPVKWFFTGLVFVLAAWLAYALVTNPGFQWQVVREYLFAEPILAGVLVTIEIVALSMSIAIALGIVLGVLRLSRNNTAYVVSSAYVWFFRGTPVLVQLIFWYNLASLYPQIQLGIPFDGPKLLSFDSNVVMTSFVAAVIALSLNEAAYYAEIVRGGVLSVESGQALAAKALGLSPVQIYRRIVLPQAMRAIVPPTGNQIIAMLKYSALASVIAVQELLYSAQSIYSRTFETIPLLIVASLWYLVLVTSLSMGQRYVERYFSRGAMVEPGRFAPAGKRMTDVFARTGVHLGRRSSEGSR